MTSTTAPAVKAGDVPSTGTAAALAERYRTVRAATERLAAPLSPEDCVVQSMPDASPTKWHLAHTTWFFETFVLGPHLDGYESFHPQFCFLFNSYYNQVGERIARPKRGLMTRPALEDVFSYRHEIDKGVERLLESADQNALRTLAPLIEIGLHHEQQHQELILTDLKHLLSENPLRPTYVRSDRPPGAPGGAPPAHKWIAFKGGVQQIGHAGSGFAYDNESPRHQTFLKPFEIASRPVTCGEFLQFIDDGGYEQPEHWLDMGWATVQEQKWRAPMYWEQRDGTWMQFTLAGMRDIDPAEPVCHVSFFEADAFARWNGVRLPTEAEWEVAAADLPIEGNFVEAEAHHPRPIASQEPPLARMFGDVWEWTASQYRPYPGYVPPAGAIGEYNGKFMCNQFVLRGGSCATPLSHIRRTYRNFFAPEARWQFSGLRLARDKS